MPQFNPAVCADWRCRTCHTFDGHHTVLPFAICASSLGVPRCPPQPRQTAAPYVCACPTQPIPSTPTSLSHPCAGYTVNTFAAQNTAGLHCWGLLHCSPSWSCLLNVLSSLHPPGAPPSRWPRALHAPSQAATKNGGDSPAPLPPSQAPPSRQLIPARNTPQLWAGEQRRQSQLPPPLGLWSEKPSCRLTHRAERLVIPHAAPRNDHPHCTSEQKTPSGSHCDIVADPSVHTVTVSIGAVAVSSGSGLHGHMLSKTSALKFCLSTTLRAVTHAQVPRQFGRNESLQFHIPRLASRFDGST